MENLNKCRSWISVTERLPTTEGYYKVKFENGEEDEKPFRIRPKKNILGFMTMDKVTHWSFINNETSIGCKTCQFINLDMSCKPCLDCFGHYSEYQPLF